MKTRVFFSALFASISLVSAAPTPDKTVDKRVPQVTVTVVPIPLAPYPNSPYTKEFQYITTTTAVMKTRLPGPRSTTHARTGLP
jgi:hypothetical protein